MALTPEEERRFRTISEMAEQDDPQLARRMARASRRRRTVQATTLAAGGVVAALIVTGILVRSPLLCAVGWTAAIGLATVRGMCGNSG